MKKGIWTKISSAILKPVVDHKTFFVFVLSLSYIIGIAGNHVGAGSDGFLNFLLNIFDTYIYCLILYAIGTLFRKFPIIAKTLCSLIYLFIAILLFSELFVVFFCRSLLTVHILQLTLETTGSESSEFVSAALYSSATWLTMAITAITLCGSLLIPKVAPKFLTTRTKQVIAFVAMALIVWSGIRQVSGYVKLANCFVANNALYCAKMRDRLHLNTPTVRLLFGISFHKANLSELKQLEKTVEASKVTACSFRCPLIVMVIGESYNKHHSHLYNKQYLETTPYMDAMEQAGSLVKYTDAITPYNMTTHVFKNLFSMFDGQGNHDTDDDNWTNHSLFTALFKRAGYNVYFVTNQFVRDDNDDWNAMGGTFMNQKHLSDLQFTWRNDRTYCYDEELLEQIPDVEELTKKPTLLIVHLIGQHVAYGERYPEKFHHFTPSNALTTYGGQTGKEIEANYANAVLYNDYIINKLFSRFKDTDVIGLYFADHGEEVYDWRDAYERTQERPIPKEVMRYQYDIPMVFYMTDTFKNNHPEVASRVLDSKNLPLVNTNLSHTLLWLGGIESSDYNRKLDVLSTSYDSKRQRILWDGEPYER